MASTKKVTAIAPVNIAVVKYWGKRDDELILPVNDSLSGTLSMEQMRATTTVAFGSKFSCSRMWLNGKEEDFSNKRLLNCIREIRRIALKQGKISAVEAEWHLRICSVNNFPTAAGLASSAAGYACLVYALAQLYGIEGDISGIARQGSGSACRSVYGGFVEWTAGSHTDGSDSIANQIVDSNYWPEMRVVILVVSDKTKKIGSTSGMQTSRDTSELFKHRVAFTAAEHQRDMRQAIRDKDFQTFGRITMQDSNQFHAICLDTYPPLVYMNDTSHAIADVIHTINQGLGRIAAAYTYDAGPNCCLYLMDSDLPVVLSAVHHMFPTTKKSSEYFSGIPVTFSETILQENLPALATATPWKSDSISYVIVTKIGEGPKTLSTAEHLLNDDGLPV